ncbi:MAG: type II secretion system protein, partial [Pseudomonadota bacterium]
MLRLFLRLLTDFNRPAPPRREEEGFTLVELMVVIVIIGLLATVVLINVLPSQ